MKTLLTIIAFALNIYSFAQDKYLEDIRNLDKADWKDVPSEIIMKPLSKKSPDFILKSKDKYTQKRVNANSVLVMYQDSLYINLKFTRVCPDYFVRAYIMDDNSILFAAAKPKTNVGYNLGFWFGLSGAVIGAAIDTNGFKDTSKLKNRFCFMIPAGKYASEALNVTPNIMEDWLMPYPELLVDYMALRPDRKLAADVIFDYLQKAGKLK